MKLDLALVLSCTDTGCLVSMVADDSHVEARYSALVQDQIWISPGQLVALNTSLAPPEVVWRWVPARVDKLAEDRVLVDDGRCTLISMANLSELNLELRPGDAVWFCKTARDAEVHDKIVAGKPANPEALLVHIEPTIASIYAES